MQLSVFDIAVLVVIAISALRGWRAGFIVMAGNLAGFVLGIVITAWLFSRLSNWHVLANWHVQHPILTILLFLAAFLVVVRALRLLVRLLNSVYRVISVIPGMGLLNHLLGTLIGVAQGVVVVVLGVYILTNVVFASGLMRDTAWLMESWSFPFIAHVTSYLPSFGIWV